MALTQITDMAARAQARVLGQYQPATARLLAWVGELGGQVQESESALFGLAAQLDVSTATGIWLERLGAIVDEARESFNDTDYRGFIQGRVLANSSQGTLEEILAISRATFTTGGATFALTDQFPAALQLVLAGATMTDGFAQRFARLLGRVRSAGVRLSMLYQTIPDAAAFTFATGSGLEASSTLGFGDSSNALTGGGFASAINA